MRILVIGAVARSLVNFRGPLLKEMVRRGHDVWVCAGDREKSTTRILEDWGVRFFATGLSRTGINPLKDALVLQRLVRRMRELRPDLVLSYAIKPNIFAGSAVRLTGVPNFYGMVEGLGYLFLGNTVRHRFLRFVACLAYRYSFSRANGIFFLNDEDVEEFCSRRLVVPNACVIVNGTGIDLEEWPCMPLPCAPAFLFVGRLLADKGVREYVDAARALRAHFPDAICRLVGEIDANPASITEKELCGWRHECVIEYLGRLDDVRPAYRQCSVYVLPSYREGIPRTVLEAMSMGRPIITTDAPGCRETIRLTENGKAERARGEPVMEGQNGFLVRPRDADALFAGMRRFLDDPGLVEKMGRLSREVAEEKYDVHNVNTAILEVMGL